MPLHERDISYFLDTTLTYLNRVTDNQIVPRDPTIEFQALVFSAYTGLIHLKGEAEGFVYVTASQSFLQIFSTARHSYRVMADETCRDALNDITTDLARNARQHFGPGFHASEPHIFSTVPDDPIEMPPAVFVQPLSWHDELAYFVIGLTPSNTNDPSFSLIL